mmetsp:Transcript_110854/g.353407  ORF Transcript_110854/g.353407 Transcript_110854/m.353407 type:complete len:223 (-) Transcript_110854:293-961(-)
MPSEMISPCACVHARSSDERVGEESADERRHEDHQEDDERRTVVNAAELRHRDVLLVDHGDLPRADASKHAVDVGAGLDDLIREGVLVAGVGLHQQVGGARSVVARNLHEVGVLGPLPLDNVADLRARLARSPLDLHVLLADDLDGDGGVLRGVLDAHGPPRPRRVRDPVLLQLAPGVRLQLLLVHGLPWHDQLARLDVAADVVALPLRLNFLLQRNLELLW